MGGHVKPRLVVIAGPTGVGKTGAAVARGEGRVGLWERRRAVAPETEARLHPTGEGRVIRAQEVVRAGAGALNGAGRGRDPRGPYDVTYVGLTLDRAALAKRLRAR